MKWYRQKSTWTGVAGLIASVGGFLTGTIDPVSALSGVGASVMAILYPEGRRNGLPLK